MGDRGGIMSLRALGGGELVGDKLVRLVYIDEAGISRPDQEPFLTVAGVIVNADRELDQIERRLTEIVQQYIPQEHQKDFVFHAHELMSGRGIFDKNKIEPKRRMEIALALARLLADLKLPLPYGYIERKKFPVTVKPSPETSKHDLIVFAHVCTFMSCAVQIDQWMRKCTTDEVCALIVERNSNAEKLMKDTQLYHQDKSITDTLDENAKKYFPFAKIKEEPWFQDKRKNSPLQLADFCAYVYKRILMDPKHKYCRPIFNILEPTIIKTSYLTTGVFAVTE